VWFKGCPTNNERRKYPDAFTWQGIFVQERMLWPWLLRLKWLDYEQPEGHFLEDTFPEGDAI
jgi:hypothetical protein